jgi:hypothetical protein
MPMMLSICAPLAVSEARVTQHRVGENVDDRFGVIVGYGLAAGDSVRRCSNGRWRGGNELAD